jgi:hypothetical protein
MDQTYTLEQLTVHLQRIEMEIVTLRQEIKTLRSQDPANGNQETSFNFVSKPMIQEQFRRLFQGLGIEGDPVGAERLQAMMLAAGLEPNELSQAIISTREE